MLYFCYIFLIFFISSILGYFVEITFCSIESKKIVFNRGFLMGPYIPIFGVGTVLIGLFLARYRNDPFIFFWMTVILCSCLVYITSYVLEEFALKSLCYSELLDYFLYIHIIPFY